MMEIYKRAIETDYNHFEEDLKWQLVKDQLVSENKLQITGRRFNEKCN